MPKDISTVGFDDMPLCDMMNPLLSTMRVNKKKLREEALERLLGRMERRDA